MTRQVTARGRFAFMYIFMYISGMAQRYSIAEARAQLPAVIDQAEGGAVVELTRRGQSVAVLVSRREFDRLKGTQQHFGDAYRQFLEKHSLDDIGIGEDFVAAVRDRTPGRKVSL